MVTRPNNDYAALLLERPFLWSNSICERQLALPASHVDGDMETSGVYVARYGPNLKNGAMLAGSVLFASASIVLDVPLHIRVLGGVLFGAGALMALLFMVDRRVALRVDAEGITLAGGLPRYNANLLSVPWAEIRAVVLWKQHSAVNSPYLGLKLHSDSATLRADSGRGRIALEYLAPHVPFEVARFSRPVNGWRLDRERLASSVAHFAPDVHIIDLG